MKQRFEHAVDALHMYFGIQRRQDFLDTILAGSSPKDHADKQMAMITGEEKISPNIGDITSLFQSQERAFFAHEIVTELDKFKTDGGDAAKELEESINVICEADLSFGKFPYKPLEGDKPTASLGAFSYHFKISSIKNKKIELKVPEGGKILNENPKEPSKDKPVLSAIMINSSLMNPGMRQTDGAAIFMNGIPTMEMSRCVPYLDILVNTASDPLSKDGKINSMSLLQFFGGNFEAKDANKQIATAKDMRLKNFVAPKAAQDKVAAKAKAGDLTTKSAAGMEIFTTPQTLVMGDEMFYEEGHSGRTAPVIDRFRPLMSVNDFKVDIAPSVGFIPMKRATLDLVLHDRSRMGEIAEFIKPDLFNQTELIITYGWSHPDGFTGANVWGEFLDSLKCTEKYSVINSQFSFDEVGQVKISLKLSLKGSMSDDMTKITDDADLKGPLEAMNNLQKMMKALRKKYPKMDEIKKPRRGKKSKGVYYDFSVSDVSTTNSIMGLDTTAQKGIERFIKMQKKNEGDEAELAKILDKFLKERGKVKKTIGKVVNEKIQSIKAKRIVGHGEGLTAPDKFYDVGSVAIGPKGPYQDPFLVEIARKKVRINAEYKVRSRKGKETTYKTEKNTTQYTSLGSLLMQFVGRPLAATGNFDEVQFVFYPFNDKASYVASIPVCCFPIKITDFQKEYEKASKISHSMPIGAFIGFLGSKFVSSQHAEAYGLSAMYEPDKEDNNKMVLTDTYAKNNQSLLDFKEERLCDAYDLWAELLEHKKPKSKAPAPQVKFRMPRLQLLKECLKGSSDDVTILRIHVFDAAQSSYSTLADIWKDAQNTSLGAISSHFSTAMKEKDVSKKKASFVKYISEALEAGILQYIDDPGKTTFDGTGDADQSFKVVAGALSTKKYIKRFIPSIDYGNATSNITNASVSSAMTPGLGDINAMRSGLGGGVTSLGSRDSGLPLAVLPVQLTIASQGFPFAAFSQQFFIDFNTGTNVDNIYRCSKISHSISPGDFKTSMSFVQINAYGQYTNMASQVANSLKEIKAKIK